MRIIVTFIPVALALATLTACGSLKEARGTVMGDNNLACSVARDKLFVVSEWFDGLVSFGTQIRKKDAEVVCAKPAATPIAAAPAPAASATK